MPSWALPHCRHLRAVRRSSLAIAQNASAKFNTASSTTMLRWPCTLNTGPLSLRCCSTSARRCSSISGGTGNVTLFCRVPIVARKRSM
ncbi:MAG: hypothetical protein K1V77_05175 [Muribaculaceae bacterium]